MRDVSQPRVLGTVLLVLSVGSLTLILQKWIGGITIYQHQPELRARQEQVHEAILHNRLPAGVTWNELGGGNGANIRVATVYAAELIHRSLNVSVLAVYRLLDTAALFAALLLLFNYLLRFTSPQYAIAGLLYVAAVLPLTYFFGYFAPWDRASFVCWVGLLTLLKSQRTVLFTILLGVSVPVKYDVILLPGLYFLQNLTPTGWRKAVWRTALMFLVSFGVWIALRTFLPGGFELPLTAAQISKQISRNWLVFRSELPISYPPFLALVVPVSLAVLGLRYSERFARASALFAVAVAVPLFIAANFVEFRAQLPILLLVLPAALAGLKRLCDGHGGQVNSPSSAQSATNGASRADAGSIGASPSWTGPLRNPEGGLRKSMS